LASAKLGEQRTVGVAQITCASPDTETLGLLFTNLKPVPHPGDGGGGAPANIGVDEVENQKSSDIGPVDKLNVRVPPVQSGKI